MDYKFIANSKYKVTGVKCGRCSEDILVEVYKHSNIPIKFARLLPVPYGKMHYCCSRMGCTWPDYHYNDIEDMIKGLGLNVDREITGAEKHNTKDLETDFDYSEIQKHQKLTMQKLVELKDKKVWDSIFIKCHLCGQFKPAKDGVLIESDMTVDVKDTTTTFKQVCEVVCSDCGNLMSAEAIVDAHCPWLNEDYRKNFLEHIRLDGEITMMTKRIKFEMVSE